jgi:hypothetical protein
LVEKFSQFGIKGDFEDWTGKKEGSWERLNYPIYLMR